jgi:hypothetical protein
MTVGKDVSMLFTDVLNCMQTHNLELKKLVYLYVMNYAKSQPERAILAVNTFQKVIMINYMYYLYECLTPSGCTRSKSLDQSFGCQNYGLHSCR